MSDNVREARFTFLMNRLSTQEPKDINSGILPLWKVILVYSRLHPGIYGVYAITAHCCPIRGSVVRKKIAQRDRYETTN